MTRGVRFSGAVIVGLAVVGALVATGWGIGWSVGRGNAPVASIVTTAVRPAATHYYLTIATPDMLGGTEDTGPAYMPSDFTLPANTDVTITITNFDDATALPAQYAKASGIKGSLAIQDLDTVHPNVTGATRSATSLDADSGVAHTFTIAAIGLNVPVAPKSRETFTFHTPTAGVYTWQCMDPCGTGPAGWGAAMSAPGFMTGKVTVA